MNFPSNAYLAAFLVSWLAALGLFPLARWFCVKFHIVDDPGHRKIHAQTVPLAGGLTVLAAMLVALALGWMALKLGGSQFRVPEPSESTYHATVVVQPLDPTSTFLLGYGFGRRAVELLGILLGGVGMLLVGLLDDRFELRAAPKFAGQAVMALLVAACGVRVTLFVPSIVFSYAVTVLWVLTVVNALNFMDNMNGLCTGLGVIASGCFAAIAGAHGQYLVASIALVSLGALLGFLPYNFPNAKAFLGDGGSHLVGYLLAVLAILPHFHTPTQPNPLAVLTPLLVLAVPLLDMAWVVALRWRMGKPFYQGDTNHLSHRLVRLGFSHTQAVAAIWLMAALAGVLACLL